MLAQIKNHTGLVFRLPESFLSREFMPLKLRGHVQALDRVPLEAALSRRGLPGSPGCISRSKSRTARGAAQNGCLAAHPRDDAICEIERSALDDSRRPCRSPDLRTQKTYSLGIPPHSVSAAFALT